MEKEEKNLGENIFAWLNDKKDFQKALTLNPAQNKNIPHNSPFLPVEISLSWSSCPLDEEREL